MRKNGTWGGNIELQAISLTFQCNIVVHQFEMPRYEVMNFPPLQRVIHLSYHDGQHYASVREFGQFGGIPDKIPLQPKPLEGTTMIIKRKKEEEKPITRDEKLIMDSTGTERRCFQFFSK